MTILTGDAVGIRERGTIEHLLVMPVTPLEIMTNKVFLALIGTGFFGIALARFRKTIGTMA